MAMGTKAFLLFLLSGFSVAFLSVFLLPNLKKHPPPSYQYLRLATNGSEDGLLTSVRVWPVNLSLIFLNSDDALTKKLIIIYIISFVEVVYFILYILMASGA